MQSFFPPSGPEPTPETHVVPPWLQPPADEYPARVLVRDIVARTDGTVVSLSHVDVFSTGIRLKVEWQLRRRNESAADWQLLHFHSHGAEAESVLRFGLSLADGSVVTTVDRTAGTFLDPPQGWSLTNQMSGGGGDASAYAGGSRLWLWPLPPAGPLELVTEWRARGIQESRTILDGSLLLDAVDRVRPLWA